MAIPYILPIGLSEGRRVSREAKWHLHHEQGQSAVWLRAVLVSCSFLLN